ncbi:signal peptide peptidase SppA [Candidatus Woesearchaeota archaeon]|nr:signal peptide peptidase SppA [Candidatus Woesearchaeota archaeon]
MVQFNGKRMAFIGIVLVVIWILSSIFANLFILNSKNYIDPSSNVGLIHVDDAITSLNDYSIVRSENIVAQIDLLLENPNIEAILIEINSPGGTPVGSKEIVDAIKRARSKNVTVVSYIRDLGASGAFWVASASDYIFSNELSIVGSIGVTGSYLDFSGLLTRYNVSYQRLVAGQYKDVGTPYRSLTLEEESMLQKRLDLMHEIFIRDVAKNRNMSVDVVKEYAEGQVFLGIEAKKMGFVDALGDKHDALNYIENIIGITPVVFEFEEESSILDFAKNFVKYGNSVSVDGSRINLE